MCSRATYLAARKFLPYQVLYNSIALNLAIEIRVHILHRAITSWKNKETTLGEDELVFAEVVSADTFLPHISKILKLIIASQIISYKCVKLIF